MGTAPRPGRAEGASEPASRVAGVSVGWPVSAPGSATAVGAAVVQQIAAAFGWRSGIDGHPDDAAEGAGQGHHGVLGTARQADGDDLPGLDAGLAQGMHHAPHAVTKLPVAEPSFPLDQGHRLVLRMEQAIGDALQEVGVAGGVRQAVVTGMGGG